MSSVDELIVEVGGGKGTRALTEPLLQIRKNTTAIVTVADGGGHSQVLREDRGVEALGDLRNVLGAMVSPEKRAKLDYRFKSIKGSGMNGYSWGNYELLYYRETSRDLGEAMERACKEFGAQGTLLPVSIDNVELVSTMDDGSIVEGEGEIDHLLPSDTRHIVKVCLRPSADIYIKAYESLVQANKIVFCAGSLWTSLVPNLIVKGFSEAVRKTNGKLIYVVNLMTNYRETPNYTVLDHVKVVCRHIGKKLDYVICNGGDIPQRAINKYSAQNSMPVYLWENEEEEISEYVNNPVITANLVMESGNGRMRHSPRLAKIIADL